MLHKYIRILVLFISVLTIFAGMVQVINPSFVLTFIHGQVSPFADQLFATIGLFMVLFGALMVHSLYSAYPDNVAVIWCGLQKAGASIAVFIGIARSLFSPVAAVVASFDLLSAIIFFMYLGNAKKAVL